MRNTDKYDSENIIKKSNHFENSNNVCHWEINTKHSQRIWLTPQCEEILGLCQTWSDLYGSSTILSSPLLSVLQLTSVPLCTPLHITHTDTFTVTAHCTPLHTTHTATFTFTAHCLMLLPLCTSLHTTHTATSRCYRCVLPCTPHTHCHLSLLPLCTPLHTTHTLPPLTATAHCLTLTVTFVTFQHHLLLLLNTVACDSHWLPHTVSCLCHLSPSLHTITSQFHLWWLSHLSPVMVICHLTQPPATVIVICHYHFIQSSNTFTSDNSLHTIICHYHLLLHSVTCLSLIIVTSHNHLTLSSLIVTLKSITVTFHCHITVSPTCHWMRHKSPRHNANGWISMKGQTVLLCQFVLLACKVNDWTQSWCYFSSWGSVHSSWLSKCYGSDCCFVSVSSSGID